MRFLLSGVVCLITYTFIFAQTEQEIFELKSRINFSDKNEKILQMTELADSTLVFIGKKEMQVHDIFEPGSFKVFDHRIPNVTFASNRKPPLNTITPISISPDGSRGIVITKSDSAAVWDLERGQQLAVLEHKSGPVCRADFSEDGKSIILMHGTLSDMGISFWDSGSFGFRSSIGVRDLRWFYFSRDGRRLFTGAGNVKKVGGLVESTMASNRIDIWDTRTGKIEKTLTSADTIKYEDAIKLNLGVSVPGDSSPVVSRNERFLVARSHNRVVVWEVEEGSTPKYEIAPTGPMKRVGLVGLSEDGKYLLTSRSDKGEIYETDSGKLYRSLPLGDPDMYGLSSDNKMVFVLTPRSVIIRELKSERLLHTFKIDAAYNTVNIPIWPGWVRKFHNLPDVLFSADGRYFMIFDDGLLKIHDTATGTHVQSLFDPERVKFGRNGKITKSGFDWSEVGWLTKSNAIYAFSKDLSTLLVWKAR